MRDSVTDNFLLKISVTSARSVNLRFSHSILLIQIIPLSGHICVRSGVVGLSAQGSRPCKGILTYFGVDRGGTWVTPILSSLGEDGENFN